MHDFAASHQAAHAPAVDIFGLFTRSPVHRVEPLPRNRGRRSDRYTVANASPWSESHTESSRSRLTPFRLVIFSCARCQELAAPVQPGAWPLCVAGALMLRGFPGDPCSATGMRAQCVSPGCFILRLVALFCPSRFRLSSPGFFRGRPAVHGEVTAQAASVTVFERFRLSFPGSSPECPLHTGQASWFEPRLYFKHFVSGVCH